MGGSPLVVSSPVLWDPPVVAYGLPPSLLLRGEMTRLPLPSGWDAASTHLLCSSPTLNFLQKVQRVISSFRYVKSTTATTMKCEAPLGRACLQTRRTRTVGPRSPVVRWRAAPSMRKTRAYRVLQGLPPVGYAHTHFRACMQSLLSPCKGYSRRKPTAK